MGLLDDAIKEHLELKRRHGADPGEVARLEHEALGPARRDPAPAAVDEPVAFEMLREHARTTNRKLVDVASAVVDGHRLLPKQPQSPAPTHGAAG